MRHFAKAGFSNITSTMILSSVLLSILITASYLSNGVLSTQIAASEFKVAENLMVSIEREIHNLIFKAGSSTIIRASFQTTAPGFTRNGSTLNVSFAGSSTRNYSIPINFFNIEGRQEITGSFNYTLQGNSSLLISSYDSSFGRVNLTKPRNWRVSLDYQRVQYTYTGRTWLYDGSTYAQTNTLEVTAILLDFGEFNVTQKSAILIANEGIDSETFTMTGNFALSAVFSNSTATIHLSDIGGDQSCGTLVNFHRVHIRISVLEGE